MSFVNIVFTSSQFICILFIFFLLIALMKISSRISNKSGKSRHYCPVPDLRGKTFHFSPLYIMLAVGFSYVYSILSLLRVVSIKGFWILSNVFVYFSWDAVSCFPSLY